MSNWLEIITIGLTFLIMLAGLFGLLVPLFPGIIIIWLSTLGYGLVQGFGTLGGWIFAVLTVLMLVGEISDNIIKGAGARRGGASWTSLGLGLVAGIIGTLLLPPFGGLIAAPLVILLYEYSRHHDWHRAIEALRGLAFGYGAAYFIRLAIGVVMILLWALWVWKG